MKIKFFLPLAFVAILGVTLSCSTQKNTGMSRAYHNLTAHFNVYFNGVESFREGEAIVISTNVNDYSRILPAFEFSDPQNISGITSQMDRAIEKGTMLIAKHSITKKPEKKSGGKTDNEAFYNQKEFNKWVDDAYLLIGKGHFYKHEFDVAIKAFDLVIRDYPNTPSRYEAFLWRATAYAEQKDYISAMLALDAYDAAGNPPASLYGHYMITYADLLLKQKQYIKSIPFLIGAIEGARNKNREIRYTFILAQVYQQTGQYALATSTYNKVRKLRPPYTTTINAAINAVSLIDSVTSVEQTKIDIERLLRDKRNLAYRDRIYYALGNAYLAEGDVEQGLENFKIAIQHSEDNVKQKALTFTRMGDVYYDIPQYKQAFLSYDSAMVYLPSTDESYSMIEKKHENLKTLVLNLDEVELQDSLQRLARMSNEERLEALDKIIFEAADKQKKALEEQQKAQMQNNTYNSLFDSQSSSGMSDGKWYFYNLAAVGMGKSEFERKWGRRKLEDNWRRANKVAVMTNSDPGSPENFEELAANGVNKQDETPVNPTFKPTNLPTRDELLANIPLTNEAMEISDKKIIDALLSIAIITRDKLYDYPMSYETLVDLLRRYPNTTVKEEVLIELYRTYQMMDDNNGMARVKNQMVREFPNSKFTLYLTDPGYINKVEAKRLAQAAEYEKTYVNYLNGNHFVVIEQANAIEASKDENLLLPKYRLLKALSYGREAQLDSFKTCLETITVKHPNTEESEVAQAFITELNNGRMPVKSSAKTQLNAQQSYLQNQDLSQADKIESTFAINSESSHSVIIVVPADVNDKKLRFNVADFNFMNYIIRDIELEFKQLPNKTKLLEIKGFERASEAMEYFYTIRQNPSVFLVEGIGTPLICAISSDNLRQVISTGKIESYYPFFIQLYLRRLPEFQPMDEADLKDAMGNLSPVVASLEDIERQQKGLSSDLPQDGFMSFEGEHYYMMIYNSANANNTQLLSVYNSYVKSLPNSKALTVTIEDVMPNKKALLVKGFSSFSEADAFTKMTSKKTNLTSIISSKRPEHFTIAPKNYNYLSQTSNLEGFKKFITQK